MIELTKYKRGQKADFRIYPGKLSGLFMNIVPESEVNNESMFFSIREDAFYIIESAILGIGFKDFNHWYKNTISGDYLTKIRHWLEGLMLRIDGARSLDDVPELRSNFPRVVLYWERNFESAKLEICNFINRFLAWLQAYVKGNDGLVVYGV